MVEAGHVYQPGGFGLQVRALQRVPIEVKCFGRRELQSPSSLTVSAGQHREQGDGLNGRRAALAALDAVIQPDTRRPCSGVLMGEGNDIFRGNPCEARDSAQVYTNHTLYKGIEAGSRLLDEFLVVEVLADHHVHHSMCECEVAAWMNREYFVGQLPVRFTTGSMT